MHVNTHAYTHTRAHKCLEKEFESAARGGIIIDGIEFPALHRVQAVFSREGLLTSHVYTMALLGSGVTLL